MARSSKSVATRTGHISKKEIDIIAQPTIRIYRIQEFKALIDEIDILNDNRTISVNNRINLRRNMMLKSLIGRYI